MAKKHFYNGLIFYGKPSTIRAIINRLSPPKYSIITLGTRKKHFIVSFETVNAPRLNEAYSISTQYPDVKVCNNYSCIEKVESAEIIYLGGVGKINRQVNDKWAEEYLKSKKKILLKNF